LNEGKNTHSSPSGRELPKREQMML